MMLLTKLEVVTGGLLFAAAVFVAGWLCVTQVFAQPVARGNAAVFGCHGHRRGHGMTSVRFISLRFVSFRLTRRRTPTSENQKRAPPPVKT